jgi:hypothetical protein
MCCAAGGLRLMSARRDSDSPSGVSGPPGVRRLTIVRIRLMLAYGSVVRPRAQSGRPGWGRRSCNKLISGSTVTHSHSLTARPPNGNAPGSGGWWRVDPRSQSGGPDRQTETPTGHSQAGTATKSDGDANGRVLHGVKTKVYQSVDQAERAFIMQYSSTQSQ